MGVPVDKNAYLFSLNYAGDPFIIVQDADAKEFILKTLKTNVKQIFLTKQIILTKYNL